MYIRLVLAVVERSLIIDGTGHVDGRLSEWMRIIVQWRRLLLLALASVSSHRTQLGIERVQACTR